MHLYLISVFIIYIGFYKNTKNNISFNLSNKKEALLCKYPNSFYKFNTIFFDCDYSFKEFKLRRPFRLKCPNIFSNSDPITVCPHTINKCFNQKNNYQHKINSKINHSIFSHTKVFSTCSNETNNQDIDQNIPFNSSDSLINGDTIEKTIKKSISSTIKEIEEIYPDEENFGGESVEMTSHDTLENYYEKNKLGNWQVLEDANILKKLIKEGEDGPNPDLNSNVTIEFEMSTLDDNFKISQHDINATMIEFPLKNAMWGLRVAIMTMKRLEQSEFMIGGKFSPPKNLVFGVGLIRPTEWIKMNIKLCNFYESDLKLIARNPTDVLKDIPEEVYTNKSYDAIIEEKTSKIKDELESKMENDPSSYLWEDISGNMTEAHRRKANEYFEKKFKFNELPDHSKDGSRGYQDYIMKTGKYFGCDLGRRIDGKSEYHFWKETPFFVDVAFLITPGIRAKHIKCEITFHNLAIYIVGKKVFEDSFCRIIDESSGSAWMMSDATTQYSPLDDDYVLEHNLTGLLPTINVDTYDDAIKKPAIMLSLKKAYTAQTLWGYVFQKS